MMKRIFIILSLIILCVCQSVHANLTEDEIRELNGATPGTFKVLLGNVISTEQSNIDSNTLSIATNASAISTLQTDVVTAQNTADTAFGRIDNISLKFLTTGDTSITNTPDLAYVRKYTRAIDEGINLAAGETLQIITFALAWEGGGNFFITPDTASGFSQVNLSVTGDNATLRFINPTIGWTLIGLVTSDTGGGVIRQNEFYN